MGSWHGLRCERGWADDELVVMYSGNMGLGHRFGEILKLAERLDGRGLGSGVPRSRSVRFVFYGGGKRREEIEGFIERHPGAAVELHDYVDAVSLSDHLASADVHLVSLDPAWTGTMVPSKLQGIFAVGRPVIHIGSAESSLGRWVNASGGGWVVRPGDVDGLRAAMEEAFSPTIRQAKGMAALDFANLHFSKESNVARLSQLFGRALPSSEFYTKA